MIKAITFDFWSTLYQGQTSNYEQRLQQLKMKIEAGSESILSWNTFETAVAVARTTWDQAWMEHHRTIGAHEWLGIILENLTVSLPEDHRIQIEQHIEEGILNNLPVLAPNIAAVIANLAKRYRLAIISDTGLTPGRVLRRILVKDNLHDYFTHLTFSDELGRSKPHPDAFLSTLQALDTSPAEAVHIGDLLRTDIAGAKAIGMRAVQYVGLRHDSSLPEVTPDAVMYNHLELSSLLDLWESAN